MEVISERRRRPSEARPGIVAILPRGEAIRNFVYSGTLDEVALHADLRVFSVDPGEGILSLLKSRYEDVALLEKVGEHRLVGSMREVLDLAHGRWLWSEAARERWRLRDLEANTGLKRLKRLSKKAVCYPFANRRGLSLLSRVERASSRWLRSTDAYVELFRKTRPSLVFNGSHVHSEIAIQAVQAAQWLGIPTATFLFSWDNLTSQGRLMPEYDYYLAWNDSIRDQLLQIYNTIRPEQVFVTGTPQFDFHFRPESYWSREEFCRRVGADAARPIIVYSTGMANHMPGEPTIVRRISEIIKEMSDLGTGTPQLLVRLYPKDQTGRFDELKRSCPDILFPEAPWDFPSLTPAPEDGPLLINTLRHAALGINIASTVSLELCMFNKPVINVGYNPPEVPTSEVDFRRYYDFDHYRPLVESGAVSLALSEDDLRKMIRQALSQPETDSFRRRALLRNMFGGMLDGQAGTRVAASLINLSKEIDRTAR